MKKKKKRHEKNSEDEEKLQQEKLYESQGIYVDSDGKNKFPLQIKQKGGEEKNERNV